MSHIVIGAGALGTATAIALRDAGHHVTVLSRSGRPAAPDVGSASVDVRDADALRAALREATTVYQCAMPPYPRWIQEFPALQTAILDATADVGADLVIGDNLYSYGRPTGVLAETSPEAPTTRKGRMRKTMADAALSAHHEGRLRVALCRPSNYIGPGYARSDSDLFRPALEGRPLQILGRSDQPHSFSYVPDVGRAMAGLGTSETAWGRAWIAPVLAPITQGELATLVWHAAGQSGTPRLRAFSPIAVRVIGAFSPLVRELGEMMYEFTEPFVADSSAIRTALGVASTPLDEAIAASLEAAAGAKIGA
ncbi:NAD-dependent epimerase/dehydratase family protein [Microbacterium sediminicola]|uniref:NAD-dependent epimerase/dehydratase family protein n=1 Tax=Microbacterium sediminicola TaxID=415210 RepID=A0ABP4THC7_9MICO